MAIRLYSYSFVCTGTICQLYIASQSNSAMSMISECDRRFASLVMNSFALKHIAPA
jgi:hypothetical protein